MVPGGPFTGFLKGCRWTTLRTFARVNLSLSVIMISIGRVTSEVFSLSLRLDYGSPRADAGNLSQPWSAVVRRRKNFQLDTLVERWTVFFQGSAPH